MNGLIASPFGFKVQANAKVEVKVVARIELWLLIDGHPHFKENRNDIPHTLYQHDKNVTSSGVMECNGITLYREAIDNVSIHLVNTRHST